MSEMIDALEEAIREHCIKVLREVSERDDPAALDTGSLVAEYAAHQANFSTARARRVHFSDAVMRSPLVAEYEDGLNAILRDIQRGNDLTRYLTSCVRSRRKRDLLLAHAGIHHLHMSDEMGPWRAKRTPHVLFVAFQPDDAYLIDLYAHESDGANWSERAILEIAVRNWPDAGLLHPALPGTTLTHDFDDTARKQLREAGINLSIEIGGRVWSSFGATATGVPLMQARMGMKVRAELDARRASGEAELLEGLKPEKTEPDEWVAIVHEEHYGFFCERLNLFVRYGRLVWP